MVERRRGGPLYVRDAGVPLRRVAFVHSGYTKRLDGTLIIEGVVPTLMQRQTDGSNGGSDGRRRTRRAVLGAVGVAFGTTLAGCSGGGGSDGASTATETTNVVDPATTEASGDRTDRGGSEPGTDDSGGGDPTSATGYSGTGCPSEPYEFECRESVIQDKDDGTEIAVTEVPTFAEDENDGWGVGIDFPWTTYDQQTLLATGRSYRGFDGAVLEHQQLDYLEEVTDSLDFAVGGARAFAKPGEFPVMATTHVIVPTDGDEALDVEVSNLTPGCSDAFVVIKRHMIESIQPL
jgi:hypothetical protein